MALEVGQRVRIVSLAQEAQSGVDEDLEEYGNKPLSVGRLGTIKEVSGEDINVLFEGDTNMVSMDASELELDG